MFETFLFGNVSRNVKNISGLTTQENSPVEKQAPAAIRSSKKPREAT
jgi:hypothetical protein